MTTSMAEALAPHVASGDVAGLVAVVARGNDVEWTVLGEQTIGGPPMRADSLFRIASAGKPITAAAVLALVADGYIQLDDPIADVLPELASQRVLRTLTGPIDDTVACRTPIRLRDLLRSTNGHGFPSDFSAPVVALLTERLHQGPPQPQHFPPPDEWMAALSGVPLLHQPGEAFTYNTAFDILGVLAARISGKPFSKYVNEWILQPLAMTDTGFSIPVAAQDRMTTYYRPDENGSLTVIDSPEGQWANEPVFASGAGGYVSTAADLLAFQRMLLDGGGDLLPTHLVHAMMTDQLSSPIRASDSVFLDGQSWGYGGSVDIEVRNKWNVIGRYGWVGGTGTSAYITPSDDSIAILLTQTELGGPTGAAVLETFWNAAATQLGHNN